MNLTIDDYNFMIHLLLDKALYIESLRSLTEETRSLSVVEQEVSSQCRTLASHFVQLRDSLYEKL